MNTKGLETLSVIITAIILLVVIVAVTWWQKETLPALIKTATETPFDDICCCKPGYTSCQVTPRQQCQQLKVSIIADMNYCNLR